MARAWECWGVAQSKNHPHSLIQKSFGTITAAHLPSLPLHSLTWCQSSGNSEKRHMLPSLLTWSHSPIFWAPGEPIFPDSAEGSFLYWSLPECSQVSFHHINMMVRISSPLAYTSYVVDCFSLLVAVTSYKVTAKTEFAPKRTAGVGSYKLLATTFSPTDQYITLSYVCFCFRIRYLVYIVDSLTSSSQPIAP